MRVAMVVENDMTVDQRVDREASALGQAGHDVTVFSLRSPQTPEHEQREHYAVSRVADYATAGWRRPFKKVAESRERARRFADAIVAWGPDAVHAHDSSTLAPAARAAKTTGAAFVYDAHELYPDQFQAEGVGGSMAVRAYWRLVERRYVPRVDASVTVSPGLAGVLHDRYGIDPVVVRNTPALQPLVRSDRLRAELGLAAETPVVLYQGLLLPERGLVPLVEATALVPDAVLVIQGTGSEEGAMRAAAARAGVEDRVRFMGWVAASEAHDYAASADVGVVIYEATTLNNRLAGPNKIFVYLMAGLPVAARDFPGPRDVVVVEDVGAVFEFATAESIAATLRDMLADPERLARWRIRARDAAEREYNWDAEKAKLVGVYERLATRAGVRA